MWRQAMLTLAQLRVRRWHLIGLAMLAVVGALAKGFEILLAASVKTPWIADALGALAWCGAVASIVLLGFLIFVVRTLGRARLAALVAMWRPLAIVLLAAWLLFFNDQCRELGVSLMIEDEVGDWVRALLLLFALVYWALNNWHSARLGLWRAARRGRIGVAPTHPAADEPGRRVTTAQTPWIFWGPRLLGVCAHMLAAASLAMAALKQPEIEGGGLAILKSASATSAVLVIFALTLAVYVVDQGAIAQNAARARGEPRTNKAGLWGLAKSLLLEWWIFLPVVTGLLVLMAWLALVGLPHSMHSFALGSLAISESAVVYLTFISTMYRRHPLGPDVSSRQRTQDDAREERRFAIWTFALFLVTIVFAVWTLYDAPAVGRIFGSMVIALFTFGALLATLNGLELTTAKAAGWLFGERARPQVFQAYAIAGILALCLVNAWLQPFHTVRRCVGEGCDKLGERLRVQRAADLWYEQAESAYKLRGGGDKDDRTPMLIVATAGGGIRAAYWTATVLDTLDKKLKASGGVRPYLFAISGVSGGSVGATAFAAALMDRDAKACDPRTDACLKATSFLGDDFFAPTLAAWIFKDTLASVLPFQVEDRQAALERGFERASNDILAKPFLSFLNPAPKFEANPPRSTWRPILLLNATHEETGKRIIASQVQIERDVFVDAYDELDVLHRDLRASTAALNSARFTYVSPAGNLGDGKGSLIDGGYYENFGALTALEIAAAARGHLGDKVKVVMLLITSDPALGKIVGDPDIDKSKTLVRIDQTGADNPCVVSVTERDPDPKLSVGPNFLPVDHQKVVNAWLNEFLAPLQGITSVREAHGNRAAAELAVQTCALYPKPLAMGPAADAAPSAQAQIAAALRSGRGVVPNQTQPAQARPGLPYFAHVGMCEADRQGPIKVTPPLGWVLSNATRKGIDGLVNECGNREQLEQLERALRPLGADDP